MHRSLIRQLKNIFFLLDEICRLYIIDSKGEREKIVERKYIEYATSVFSSCKCSKCEDIICLSFMFFETSMLSTNTISFESHPSKFISCWLFSSLKCVFKIGLLFFVSVKNWLFLFLKKETLCRQHYLWNYDFRLHLFLIQSEARKTRGKCLVQFWEYFALFITLNG